MNALLTIGIILSFFQFILILNKRKKGIPDKILALGLCAIGFHLLEFHLYHLGYWERYPHLIGLTVPFPLLYGPIIFIYTKYSLTKESRLNKLDYLHFAPALLTYLYMIKLFFFYTGKEKLMIISGEIEDFDLFTTIQLVLFIASGIAYSILSYKKIETHKRLVNNNFSYNEKISLNWLRNCILGIGLVFLSIAFVVSLRNGLGLEFPFNADLIFFTFIVIIISCIGFFGIQHQNIYSNVSLNEQNSLVLTPSPGVYKKSGLKEETAESIHKKLIQVMVEEKLYLNPKLTLNDLAEKIDVTTNHLSQTINQFEKVNFHDFVNKYRVDEFIARAKSNNNFNILAHALDSGFNSKSSFNIVFKKFKATTPSKYIASLNQDS